MELLTHGREHHEIGDGGWLMMTTATLGGHLRGGDRAAEDPCGDEIRVIEDPIRRHLGFGEGAAAVGIAEVVPRQLPRRALLAGDDDPGARGTAAASEVVDDATPRLRNCRRHLIRLQLSMFQTLLFLFWTQICMI